MLSVENLHKSYAGQILFDGLSFRINSKERVGLVGRNGHGKSTLFRIMVGRESADEGDVIMPKGCRIGHVRQHIEFTQDTVLKEGVTGLPPMEKEHHWKVEKVLSGLGFSPEDMHRHPDEFSGGYQVRLNLAKVLVSDPDLLLLDEPTNYLDITSIRWIERFLVNWPNMLMLITHDRGFMDKVATHIVGIHRQKARKIKGGTDKYYDQITQEELIHENTRQNDERKRKEIEQFITRFRAKARLANLVQSRVKTLAKMEKKDKLQEIRNLEFTFREKSFNAKQMLTADNLSFQYDGHPPLFEQFDFSVRAGEKVCVIGPNGRGKTTLLKVLAGKFTRPSGTVIYHPNVDAGFYEQTNVESLVPGRTVEEEILYAAGGIDRQISRNICGAMLFSGEAALKRIEVLSGGEKARVMLGKLLATPVNLLLLDEPTNHLDMDTCDALLEAVDAFSGAVIMVTHNEMFLHALADRLVVFHDGGVQVFEGGYQRFLESGGWGDDDRLIRASKSSSGEKVTKKAMRQLRSEMNAEKSRVIKPIKKAINRIETKIEIAEDRLAIANERMVAASLASDGEKISVLSPKINKLEKEIDRLYSDLEKQSNRLDNENKRYDNKLSKLLS